MSYQPLPPGLDAAAIAALESSIDAAIAVLEPMNIDLTKKERQGAESIGDERLPFAVDYYTNKDDYPTLKPTFMNEANAVTHWDISHGTANLELKVAKFTELLSDIRINSEHFAMKYALEGYNVAGRAKDANVPGADTFYDMLSRHFEQNPTATPPADDSEPAPDTP